jgi:hypothetical protein
MKNCWRSRAARLESDQLKLDFICRYFRINMAINAVHICVLTALALVPRNDFTFAVCFSALKNSCRVRDWRGFSVGAIRFQALPLRTVHEVFPHTAHPVSLVERVMCRFLMMVTFTAYFPHRAVAGLSSPSTAQGFRRGMCYSIAAIRYLFFAAASAELKGCAPSSPCSRALR